MKLDKILQGAVDECPLPVKLVLGTKHYKVLVDGAFVAILPQGALQSTDNRSSLNVRAQIRRHTKKVLAARDTTT